MENNTTTKYGKNVKTKGAGCLGAFLIGGILGLLLIILAIMAYSTYNGLVMREEKVKAQWAQVENLYQQRADLVNNLVATVKGYAVHEYRTLTDVIEARAKATSITVKADKLDENTLRAFESAQQDLTSTLSRLMVVIEKYPDLKANENFIRLQEDLKVIENNIVAARNVFNEVAQDYNVYSRRFPRNIFASLFNFEPVAYFKATEGSQKAPEVKFEY